jgi:hypothetical protein
MRRLFILAVLLVLMVFASVAQAGRFCGSTPCSSGDSLIPGFISSSTLTCGAGQQGKAAMQAGYMKYCDGSATSTARIAAQGDVFGGAQGVQRHATDCSTFTDEAELCWQSDTDALYVGDGAGGVVNINAGGAGDITDVFDCATGNCNSITLSDTDLLDMSSVSVTSATEGLILPGHATDCSASGTAEGQVCWEADADVLYIGDGATVASVGGAETNDLESVATSAGDAEVFVGTGAGTGAYIAGLAACAADEKIEYTAGSPDTFGCEAIGSLVEADIGDLSHTPAFSAVGAGTNTNALVVGSGGTLNPASDGEIVSTEEWVQIWNDTGSTLFKCTPVYVSGFNIPNSLPTAAIADADNASTMPALGLIEDDIANGAAGWVLTGGLMEAAETITGGGETWTEGDALYVNDSGTAADDSCENALTNVRPANVDDAIQKVGTVLYANAALGKIEVSGAGRSNDVPNLEAAKLWVGNGSNVATAVSMSSEATMDNAGAVTLADTVTVSDWTMDFGGGGGVYTDENVRILASDFVLSTNPPGEAVYGSNYPSDVLDFATGADDQAYYSLLIPPDFNDTKQVNMVWTIRWTADTATTGDVCFCIAADPVDNGEDPDQAGATVTSCADVTVAGADDLEETTFTMAASTFENEELMNIRLYRDVDAGGAGCTADDMNDDASVFGVVLNYGVFKQ